jgi:hypothetical protein
MHLRIACFVALASAAGSLPASAQDFNDSNSFGLNANFSVQMPLDSKAQTADMAKAIAQLSQQLGDLANRECDVLSDVFKAECHVTQLNIGTNVNERRNRRLSGNDGEQQKIVNANVQATFTLTPNATAPKPAPTSTP